jgi:hypothetical protein
MDRSKQLARRRAELVARSARLRGNLAIDGARISSRLGLVDRGIALARAATRQPLLLAAGAGLLLTLRPLRAMKWVARGALLFSIARRVLGALDRGNASNEPPTFI